MVYSIRGQQASQELRQAGLLFASLQTSCSHAHAAAASSVLCTDTRPLRLPRALEAPVPPALKSNLKAACVVRGHSGDGWAGCSVWKGLLLTVPLLARCVGHSSGAVLISPELAA